VRSLQIAGYYVSSQDAAVGEETFDDAQIANAPAFTTGICSLLTYNDQK